MKRLILVMCLIFSLFSVLAGCDSVLEKEKEDPIDALIAYKDTYVGDATAVSHISYILPAGEHVKTISLQTNETPYEIAITYGIKEEADVTEETFESDWNENNTKKALLNNAIAFFTLVNNVDVVTLSVETTSPQLLTVTREQIEEFVGKNVREYASDAELWKEEIEEGIINNDEKVKAFYTLYPLQ